MAAIFATVEDLGALLVRLRPDSTDTLSTVNLQDRLNNQESRVRAAAKGYSLPTSPGTTNRHWILKLLVLRRVAAEILVTVGSQWDPALTQLSQRFLKIADFEFDLFKASAFDFAFSSVLPETPLASPEDLIGVVPGWKATDSDEPTRAQAELLINCWSAVVHAFCAFAGYDTSDLNETKAALLRAIVKDCVGAALLWAKSEVMVVDRQTPALDPEAWLTWIAGNNKLQELLSGDYDGVFEG